MNQKTGHPRANLHAVLKKLNYGSQVEPLVKERLQYLVDGENNVDVGHFEAAAEQLLDSTPDLRAAVTLHRERAAREAAHKKTFGAEGR